MGIGLSSSKKDIRAFDTSSYYPFTCSEASSLTACRDCSTSLKK